MRTSPARVLEDAWLRNVPYAYWDREEAGLKLARMLGGRLKPDTLVLGIPTGGVPVGVALARALALTFDVAVVSRLLLPWDTQSGAAAVAFDGEYTVDPELMPQLGLTAAQLEDCIAVTRREVRACIDRFDPAFGRAPVPTGFPADPPPVRGRDVVLVDDALVCGVTIRAAVEAVRRHGAERVVVAVPSGHEEFLRLVEPLVDLIACPNILQGLNVSLVACYSQIHTVTEEEARNVVTAGMHPDHRDPDGR